MRRSKPPEPLPAPGEAWVWPALFLALALVPDQKLLRWKVLALQAGIAGLWAWPLLKRLAGRPLERPRTALDLPVLLYGLSGLLFFALSPEPRNSESELVRILFSCAAFFLSARVFAGLPEPAQPLSLWALAAALAGGRAVLERLGLGFAALARPEAGFGNPIFLGAYLAASLVLTAGLLAQAPSVRARLLLGSAAALQAAGLWLAQSRAALGGLLAAALLWGLLRLEGRRRAGLLAAALAAGGLLVWHFWSRRWTHGLIWEGAWRLWLDHPWLGAGLGRFHLEFPAYAPEALKALWPQHRMIVNFAHNEYLQVLSETGPLGLAAFAAVPASAAWALSRARPRPLADAAALSALALFAAALFSPDLRFGASSFAAFAALGASAALSREGDSRATLGPAAALAAAGTLGLWLVLAARPVLAVRTMLAAPDFHAASPEAQAELARMEEALSRRPDDADLAERLAYLYAKEKAFPEALSRYELAARLAPGRPGPHNNLGNLFYLSGDLDRAIASWRRSLAADPAQKDARLNLAKALYEAGRLKESARELELILEKDPGDDKARVLLKKMVE